MNKKLNIAFVALITIALIAIASLIILGLSSFGLILLLVVLIVGAGEYAILYFLKRNVLYRRQNVFAISSVILIGVTFIVAVVDIKVGANTLPLWTPVLGILLFFSGNYLLVTSLFSIPRHGKIEYNEDEKPEKNMLSEHGPYDVIRHPINLAGVLLVLSIPLMLGSPFAFIPASVTLIMIVIQAVTIENYRFEHYEWYYDYTKRVPYMMIPAIW